MIRVDFIYKCKTSDIEKLNEKFIFSGDPMFDSEITNTGIERKDYNIGNYTFVWLAIFYNNVEEYNIRTNFEQSFDQWKECWKEPNDLFTLVSKEIVELD